MTIRERTADRRPARLLRAPLVSPDGQRLRRTPGRHHALPGRPCRHGARLPLLAIGIYSLLDGLRGRAAAAGRIALIPFVVFYVPYVAFEGIALGVLGEQLNGLTAGQRDAIAPEMVQDFASNPILGEPGLFWALGSTALTVVMVSTVLAFRRAGARPALQVLLGASVLIGAHAPPLASIGWACFAAAGWMVLRARQPAVEKPAALAAA